MDELELINSMVDHGDIIYDIGAHVGLVSSYLNNNKKDLKFFCFEPSVNNYPILLNNCGHFAKCFDVAIHEKEYDCQTRFKDCKTDYIDIHGKKLDTIQPIKYVLLENFIKQNNLPLPNFMKLDIEGMEGLVLKTFQFLFKNKVKMYIEIHAQPKDMDNQNYENNPHFIFKEDGGFDFNELKRHNYTVSNNNGKLDINDDWNPKQGTHGYLILNT